MKKNASFIMMDSALAQSLYQALETLPVQSAYAEELRQGLRDLLDGDAATLVLGLAGQSESLAGLMDDGIYAGALEIHPKSRRVLYDGKEIGLPPRSLTSCTFWLKTKARSLPRSRSTRRCGPRTTSWPTATSWPLSASSGKRLSPTPTRQSLS